MSAGLVGNLGCEETHRGVRMARGASGIVSTPQVDRPRKGPLARIVIGPEQGSEACWRPGPRTATSGYRMAKTGPALPVRLCWMAVLGDQCEPVSTKRAARENTLGTPGDFLTF